MIPSWRYWYWKLGVASLSAITGAIITDSGDCTLAQITPDGTLGAESSVVTSIGASERINGGAVRGANLFHSFREFSVFSGRTAYFNNAVDIQNIISRVTGRSVSNIDGLIRANGTANLFLINPHGIIFGPNARLNIGGSFLGSTASSLNFADGTQFSTTTPQTTSLLTVSVPLGLQFGANPASILNKGRYSDIFSFPGQPQVVRTLALVGGDISLEGESLTLTGGRVELGGVAGAGVIGLLFDGNLLRLSFPNDVALADVSLTNGAQVNMTSGSVNIRARSLFITDRSGLIINTRSGQESAANLSILVDDLVALSNNSQIFSGVNPSATGNGGNIVIQAGSLSLTNGSQVSAAVFPGGQGNAGNVNIEVSDTVSFDGVSSNGFSSGVYSSVYERAVGNGGKINIQAGSLSVTNGAQVSASSEGIGAAGNIEVTARSINLENRALLSADSTAGQGSIFLRSQDLVLRRGSNITTNAIGTATGGNITIDTGVLVALENSDISANAQEARGGRVIISASGIFGIESRNQSTPESDITATFVRGPEINTLDVDPSQGLANLPAELVEASRLIATGCAAVGENEFTVTGRGGIPPNPSDTLSSDTVWTDLRPLTQQAENRPSSEEVTQETNSTPEQLVEAQEWVINELGEVVLTAQAPTVTLHVPWLPSSDCHAPEPSS